MQSMSDDPLTECVECGAPVRKVLHPVGISFKGSGFYSTDYKRAAKTETPDKPAAKSIDSGTNGASGDTSEKKPEKASTEPAKKGD